MSRRRAARRRLDPWAALLLGVLVTLAVIILLATPGPWHKVVPAVATRPPLAPPAPPGNVAVFVNGPHHQGCAGVVWLHIAYDEPTFTAVVVPVRLSCHLPGAGLQPLSEIVDQAGPGAAASSLADRLGVTFGAWITIDPVALRAALPGFVDVATKVVHPRPVPLVGVWTRRQPPVRALQRQVHYLRLVLRDGSADEVNLVGLVNYVLGSTDVNTSLKLQAVSAIGAALNGAVAGDLVTSSLPVVVRRRGSYERWLPAPGALLALRQSFAFDAASPVYPVTVDVRRAGRTVVALTSPLGRLEGDYRTALERTLHTYGARNVRVLVRPCRSPADVARALAGRSGGPPLGVVVALGDRSGSAGAAQQATQLLDAALATVKALALPAVVSQLPFETPFNDVIRTRTASAGLPLAPVAAVLSNPAVGASPAPPATTASPTGAAQAGPTPTGASVGPTPTAAGSATPTAAGGPTPTSAPAPSVRTLTPALVAAWARLDAATFVRAVQPQFFAPRLAATRLGVSYYLRTLTRVAVAGRGPSAARVVSRLEVFGWRAQRASAGSLAASSLPLVYYRQGDRQLALALAGDLGMAASQVVQTTGGPLGLTLVLPG